MHRKASQARCRPSFIGLARANVAGDRHCECSEEIQRPAWSLDCFAAFAARNGRNNDRRRTHDRVSDSARIGRPGRDRGVGGIFVSAEILRLIARPDRFRGPTDFPMIVSRSAAGPENPIDMLPCEHVWPDKIESAFAGT
jgi:hypothetical protein